MSNTLKFGNGQWGTKVGSALAYNDLDGNFKPLPFDFTRSTSATRINKDGLIEVVTNNKPRIDFKDDSKGAFLLEPERSNLVQYSEDFSNAWWSKQTFGTGVEASVISTTELAPDGSTNAFLVTLNSGNGTTPSDQARIDKSINGLTGGLDYTESIYLKGVNGGEQVLLGVSNIGTIKVTLTTEWKRFVLSGTSGGGFNGVGPLIRRGLQEPLNSYAQFYMWGSQFEQGSYATSYIPTQGSAVTRVADACSNENLNVDYSGDYTLYLEHETLSLTEYNQFQFRQETSISYIFRVGNSLNIGTNLYTAANTIGFNKFALSVGSDGSYSFYKNGSLLSSGSGLNANLETIKNDALGMSIKDIKLYNTRLSNAELQALTSN